MMLSCTRDEIWNFIAQWDDEIRQTFPNLIMLGVESLSGESARLVMVFSTKKQAVDFEQSFGEMTELTKLLVALRNVPHVAAGGSIPDDSLGAN